MRYMLNVLGVNQLAYWSANFFFDLLCFYMQAGLMIVLVYPLKLRAYKNRVDDFIAILGLFGPAHTLFSYLLSFCFMNPHVALKFISLIYMVAGFVLPLCFRIISIGATRCNGFLYPLAMAIAQMVPI